MRWEVHISRLSLYNPFPLPSSISFISQTVVCSINNQCKPFEQIPMVTLTLPLSIKQESIFHKKRNGLSLYLHVFVAISTGSVQFIHSFINIFLWKSLIMYSRSLSLWLINVIQLFRRIDTWNPLIVTTPITAPVIFFQTTTPRCFTSWRNNADIVLG